MNTISIIALILIFLGGIGAILLTIGQSISSAQDKDDIINTTKNENERLKSDLTELRKERKELNEILEKRDLALQLKNDTIIELNQKLSEKSEYIKDYLTGGKGFLKVDIENFATNNFAELKGIFIIRSVSEFPAYNIGVTILDFDLLEEKLEQTPSRKLPVISMVKYNQAKLVAQRIDELAPNSGYWFDKKINMRESRYYIKLVTRNNIFIEKMVSIVHKTILHYGYQVFTPDGKMVFQYFGERSNDNVKGLLLEKLKTIPIDHSFEVME